MLGGEGGYELISRDLLSRVVQKSGTWLLNLTAKFSLSLGCTANDLGSLEMKLRDLFHAFRHPERESRCHEIDDGDREAMAQRVEALLATRLTLADLSASQDVPQAEKPFIARRQAAKLAHANAKEALTHSAY